MYAQSHLEDVLFQFLKLPLNYKKFYRVELRKERSKNAKTQTSVNIFSS